MKAIKDPDLFTESDYENHCAILEHPRIMHGGYPNASKQVNNALIHLLEAGLQLIDGEKNGWQNSNDTLVLAVPSESVLPFLFTQCLMTVGNLRANEVHAEKLEGVPGFSFIIRFWWD